MKPTTILLLTTLLASCGSGSASKEKSQKDSATQSAPATDAPGTTTTTAVVKEEAQVSFSVNGTTADTQPKASGDTDPQQGLLNLLNNNLSFDLLGDDPARPHRGWVHFSLNDFKTEPAVYTATGNNELRFTRYETANAGGSTDYKASAGSAGSSFTIDVTKVEKRENGSSGGQYLLSGTFSAHLVLGEYSQNTLKTVDITAGTFDKVPVSVLGKK